VATARRPIGVADKGIFTSESADFEGGAGLWGESLQVGPRARLNLGPLDRLLIVRLPENYSGATSDSHLVQLWLAGRPSNTAAAYSRDADSFLGFLESEAICLQDAKVDHVVRYVETLTGAPATVARKVRSLKSLLTYAHRTGYTVFNVGKVLRAPSIPNRLHERILTEETVKALIQAAAPGRDRLLIALLYYAGSRITETLGLSWKDLGPGNATFHGKGGKTRTVAIPEDLIAELRKLRWADDTNDSAVFKSSWGNRLCRREGCRVVHEAADAIGEKASPHWLRHAHASHSLDHGAPIHLLQACLGHSSVATTSKYLHVRPNEGTSQFLNF